MKFNNLFIFLVSCLFTVGCQSTPTPEWTQNSPMPTARWAYAASVVEGRIYIIGGSATVYPHKPYLEDVME